MKPISLIAFVSLSLTCSNAFADRHETQAVHRSYTGGSAGVDTIEIAKSEKTVDASARAQLKTQSDDQKKAAALPRTAQRSFSGGAAAADHIVIEKR